MAFTPETRSMCALITKHLDRGCLDVWDSGEGPSLQRETSRNYGLVQLNMNNFNPNSALCVALIFSFFWPSSNRCWCVAECSQAVSAYSHVRCIHIMAPHVSSGIHCQYIWRYDRWYIIAFEFRYLCFALHGRSVFQGFWRECPIMTGVYHRLCRLAVVWAWVLWISVYRVSARNSVLLDSNGVRCRRHDTIRFKGAREQFRICFHGHFVLSGCAQQ